MKYLFFIVLLVAVVITAGCVNNQNTVISPTPTSEIKLSTIEPSEMALQLSDLPSDFAIKDRSEIISSPNDGDFNWKSGYYVRFSKINVQTLQNTEVDQIINIYSTEDLPKVFAEAKGKFQNSTNQNVDVLSDPKIGDKSQAFRATDSGTSIYLVSFSKKDVFENFIMGGSSTDYELLKDLAKKAAEKIK